MYIALENASVPVLLSYNVSYNIRNIIKDYNIYKIKTKYSPANYLQYRSIKVMVITNYIVK